MSGSFWQELEFGARQAAEVVRSHGDLSFQEKAAVHGFVALCHRCDATREQAVALLVEEQPKLSATHAERIVSYLYPVRDAARERLMSYRRVAA